MPNTLDGREGPERLRAAFRPSHQGVEMLIREFVMPDLDTVVELWRAAGIGLSAGDDCDGIAAKLERDPDLFLVACVGDEIVGAVMGAYDGRRGWLYHLAVSSTNCRRGVGRALVVEVESRLKTKGCLKVNLLIEADNSSVRPFYERHGYAVDELVFMEKWLR